MTVIFSSPNLQKITNDYYSLNSDKEKILLSELKKLESKPVLMREKIKDIISKSQNDLELAGIILGCDEINFFLSADDLLQIILLKEEFSLNILDRENLLDKMYVGHLQQVANKYEKFVLEILDRENILHNVQIGFLLSNMVENNIKLAFSLLDRENLHQNFHICSLLSEIAQENKELALAIWQKKSLVSQLSKYHLLSQITEQYKEFA